MCNKASESSTESMRETSRNNERKRKGSYELDKSSKWDNLSKASGKGAKSIFKFGGSFSKENKKTGNKTDVLKRKWNNSDVSSSASASANSAYNAFQQDCDELVKGYFARDTAKITDAGETKRVEIQADVQVKLKQMDIDQQNALIERQEKMQRRQLEQQQQSQYIQMGGALLQNLFTQPAQPVNNQQGASSAEIEQLKQLVIQQNQQIEQLKNQQN